MVSNPEQQLCRQVRAMLADLPMRASIPASEEFREVLTSLAYYIPSVLGELHPEWTLQGLDNITPVVARKTGEGELEIWGVACLVCDQTLAPLHLHLQVDRFEDHVSWLTCRLGERGDAGMIRKPYRLLREMTKRVGQLDGNGESADWHYRVTFGQRV